MVGGRNRINIISKSAFLSGQDRQDFTTEETSTGEGWSPKTQRALSFPRDLKCIKLTLIPSFLGRMLVSTWVDFLLVSH